MKAVPKALISPRVELMAKVLESLDSPCELVLPDGEVLRFGTGASAFRVILRNERALRVPLNEFALGQSYVEGDIDVEGDMMELLDLRDRLGEAVALRQRLRFAADLFVRRPTQVNFEKISHHYTFGDDFYLTFIDQRYRFYSHCVFHRDDETLEQAAEHKLESMWNGLGLAPGMRLLDIGGGWGGVTEYSGGRGVDVTSLTLVEDSAKYIRSLIAEKNLPGRVCVEDMLEHRPQQPYDHAVIFGVIEHIPNYRLFCTRVWDALKPGGRLYIDASATKQKYHMGSFMRHYIWRGTDAFMSLQDIVAELLFHGFEVLEVARETRDYELTMRHWAERLDANREKIVAQWGSELYRAFRLFLWGGSHAFKTNRLQAYHLIAERREDPGPRPGSLRRTGQFLMSLR